MTKFLLNFIFLNIFIALSASNIFAQDAGTLTKETILEKQVSYDGNIYVAVNEEELTIERKKEFQAAGITIKGIYNDGTVVISIPKEDAGTLTKKSNLGLHTIDNGLKISEELNYSGNAGIAITFYRELSDKAISNIKNDYSITENEFSFDGNQILIGNIDASTLEAVASLPEVAYISALVDEPEPLADDAISFNHGASLSSPFGLDLKGAGMIVGLGDGGKLQNHIDFEGRVIDKAGSTYSSYLDHADKMAGIIAGAGNINEAYRGYAPEATLLTAKTFRIFYYMHEYYTAHGMRLTNNSYGSSFSCTTAGAYDYYSTMMDQQMINYPDALHIVAAGNSGGYTCGDYPLGYNTVLKTYAAAKNVLTVGGILEDRSLNPVSGRGPVMDGRIKPEIVTLSQSLATTGGNYNYSAIAGTSSATANATGATTLLYERYKEITGTNPEGALLKAVLCNTADDAGNAGPDFQYGFGVMNIQQAVDNIDAGNYILGEASANTPNLTYTIDVPAGEKELKVLLTWSDLPQPITNAATLINDLDLKVTAPDGTTFNPWVLDHSPSGVANVATRGFDRINNIEQVTISTPVAGTYTIEVRTIDLNSAVQKFAISHTTTHDKMDITYPVKGEMFSFNENILITWDANLEGTTGYEIDYTEDNGTTWNAIGTATATASSYSWNVPTANKLNVKMRITALGTGTESISEPFSILQKPSGFTVEALCGSYVQLNWNNTPNAVSYEVYRMGEKEMTLVTSVTDSEYLMENRMDAGEMYWFAVNAVMEDGTKSRRTLAKSVVGIDTYPCPFENDVEIGTIEGGAKKGRELTSLSLSNVQQLSVEIFNSGTNSVTDIPLVYRVNGVETTETVTAVIAPGETYTHTSNAFDFSIAGEHNVEVLADVVGDTQRDLNIGTANYIQLANAVIPMPTYDDMDDQDHFTTTESIFGPEQVPYMDFNTVNNVGSLSLLDNNDSQGNVIKVTNASYTEESEIIITRNISPNFETYVRLNYKVVVPGPESEAVQTGNISRVELSVRSSDTGNWILITNLETTGEWREYGKLYNLTKSVRNASEEFTESTQLRFRLIGDADLELDELSFMSAQNLLPVELSSFEATRVEDDALLKWVTASELNNEYFEIQVAKGDEEFRRGEFITLDRVEGQGTTVEETIYTYNDVSRFKSDTRYYRLKQVDYDGTYEYSEVKSVRFEIQPELDLRIYPNPFVSGRNPNIYFELEYDSEVRFTLTDSAGRIIKEFNNTYSAGAHDFELDLPLDLESGLYYFSGMLEGKEVISKILKMND